jgi:hypothetical protein
LESPWPYSFQVVANFQLIKHFQLVNQWPAAAD